MPHTELSPATRQWLAEGRAWVEEGFEGADDFDTNPGTKLRVIEGILPLVKPGETWKLQALGVVFGDAISLAYGYPWVQLPEGLDATPALLLSEVPEPIYAYPVTMIAKRREAGQDLDYVALVELAENVVRAIR